MLPESICKNYVCGLKCLQELGYAPGRLRLVSLLRRLYAFRYRPISCGIVILAKATLCQLNILIQNWFCHTYIEQVMESKRGQDDKLGFLLSCISNTWRKRWLLPCRVMYGFCLKSMDSTFFMPLVIIHISRQTFDRNDLLNLVHKKLDLTWDPATVCVTKKAEETCFWVHQYWPDLKGRDRDGMNKAKQIFDGQNFYWECGASTLGRWGAGVQEGRIVHKKKGLYQWLDFITGQQKLIS